MQLAHGLTLSGNMNMDRAAPSQESHAGAQRDICLAFPHRNDLHVWVDASDLEPTTPDLISALMLGRSSACISSCNLHIANFSTCSALRPHQFQMHIRQQRSAADSAFHPAASRQDQLEWEQALTCTSNNSELVSLATVDNRNEVHPYDGIPLVTPHPAVGGTQKVCAAWEEALGNKPAVGSVTRRTSASQRPAVFAVVECGSHSTRLLISTGSSDIVRLTRDTHLGAAVSTQAGTSAATTSSQAAAATLAAVREYKQVLDQHTPYLDVVATAAVREAAEGPAIAAAISGVLQRPLRILSGTEEAQLAFKGATAELSSRVAASRAASRPCLLIDMGGRSTEFAFGIAGTLPQLTASIPLGCLSVRQALVQATSSRVAPAQDYQQLQQAAQGILDAHSSQLAHIRSALDTQQQQAAQEQEQQGVCPAVVVIATGGTVTTLAALQQQLEQYEHNAVHMSVLHKHQIQQLLQQYLYADAHRMDYQPSWLTAVRGAALSPGCAGLLVLMDWLGADKVVVSDSDLLDGTVAELLQQYELQHDQ